MTPEMQKPHDGGACGHQKTRQRGGLFIPTGRVWLCGGLLVGDKVLPHLAHLTN